MALSQKTLSRLLSPNSDGVVFYHGPSMLDGQPIIAIATGLRRGSDNPKTGDMVQTYILRSDIPPLEAIHSGADVSVGGNCPLRGIVNAGKNKGRACYVNVFMAPRGIWETFKKGGYPVAVDLAETFKNKKVRLGAYGDPAAVPLSVWQAVLSRAEMHAGYTHQWEQFPEFANIVMASVESKEDRRRAKEKGFRTFRVTTEDSKQDREKDEFVCPASDEMKKTMPIAVTCEDCSACAGRSAKNKADVVAKGHGSAPKLKALKALQIAA